MNIKKLFKIGLIYSIVLENHSFTSHNQPSEKYLTLVFILTILLFFVEFTGSYISNSFALLADAFHMLQDIIALGIAVFAVNLVKRPKDK